VRNQTDAEYQVPRPPLFLSAMISITYSSMFSLSSLYSLKGYMSRSFRCFMDHESPIPIGVFVASRIQSLSRLS
jgi:hypothetical protein